MCKQIFNDFWIKNPVNTNCSCKVKQIWYVVKLCVEGISILRTTWGLIVTNMTMIARCDNLPRCPATQILPEWVLGGYDTCMILNCCKRVYCRLIRFLFCWKIFLSNPRSSSCYWVAARTTHFRTGWSNYGLITFQLIPIIVSTNQAIKITWSRKALFDC